MEVVALTQFVLFASDTGGYDLYSPYDIMAFREKANKATLCSPFAGSVCLGAMSKHGQ